MTTEQAAIETRLALLAPEAWAEVTDSPDVAAMRASILDGMSDPRWPQEGDDGPFRHLLAACEAELAARGDLDRARRIHEEHGPAVRRRQRADLS